MTVSKEMHMKDSKSMIDNIKLTEDCTDKNFLGYWSNNNLEGTLSEPIQWKDSEKTADMPNHLNMKMIAVKNLAVREWNCPQCGLHHDRDINAAINLKNYYTVATTGIEARGEDVRPIAEVYCTETKGSLSETRKVVGL